MYRRPTGNDPVIPEPAMLVARPLAASQLALEALDTATAVDELLLARVEGVALIADLDLDRVLGGTRLERVPTGAHDLRDHVLRWMLDFMTLTFSGMVPGVICRLRIDPSAVAQRALRDGCASCQAQPANARSAADRGEL